METVAQVVTWSEDKLKWMERIRSGVKQQVKYALGHQLRAGATREQAFLHGQHDMLLSSSPTDHDFGIAAS